MIPEDIKLARSIRQSLIFSNYQELLVIFAYVCACISRFVGWYIHGTDAVFRYLTAGSILLSINWLKWDRGKIIVAVFLLISLAARRLLVVWTLVAFAYQIIVLKIPVRRLAKIGFISLGFIIMFQSLGVILGLVENNGRLYPKTAKLIYDLGTGNANVIGAIFLFFNLCSYIVLKNHHKLLFIIITTIVMIVGYSICGSRTFLYSSFILEILALAIWIGAIKKWMRWFFAIIPVVLCFSTFWLAANMDDNQEVNETASSRLYYIVKLTNEYSTKEWIVGAPRDDEGEPVDNVYLLLTMTGGLALITFYCIGFAGACIGDFHKIKPYLPFLVALTFGGLTESYYATPNSASMIYWIFVMIPYFKEKPLLT